MNWSEILLAYLHDPPDKALSIRGHVARARDNAQIAVGEHVSRSVLEDAVSAADPLASIIERLPMPTAGDEGQRAVGPQNGQLQIVHPVSTTCKALNVPELTEELTRNERRCLEEIVATLPGEGELQARNRFLAVWRVWPDALAANVDQCLAQLPADTRTPDHTIWNHLDITAAFKATESKGGGAALLAFALSPVQRFIEAARSVRDLWSGSMILSWLAFQAMRPVIEELGPTALVYPALRGNALLDLYLRNDQGLGNKVPPPEIERLLTPSLPHRFLAIVPRGADGAAAQSLAAECFDALKRAWKEMASSVKENVQEAMDSLNPGWDHRWDSQIANYFSAATAVLPLGGSGEAIDSRLSRLLANQESFGAAFKDAEALREMARSIPESDGPNYAQDHAGRWQYQVDLVQRSLAAHRTIRHVPTSTELNSNNRFPQKCTLLGSFEQVGPDQLKESRVFWEGNSEQGIEGAMQKLKLPGGRLRNGEALCAVALVKRFAAPAFLIGRLGLTMDDLWFWDTWTVAAAEWLKRAQIDPRLVRQQHGDWNGHWLHWLRPDQDLSDADKCPTEVLAQIQNARKPENCGAPPVYYAILKLDGDDLGALLRGERSPKVREAMHSDLETYYDGLGEVAKAGLDAQRPVGPTLHAAISSALANFALHVVPKLIKRLHGTVIYSGGDDTLVLLPLSTALECALELRHAYMRDWFASDGREHLMMGSRTLSGGLVVVHAKDDLRLALQQVRTAEKIAKDAGKDALAITVCRRSGAHETTLCPWDFAEIVIQWTKAFSPVDGSAGASDRWAYHLVGEIPTLVGLDQEAIASEIRRQVNRAETATRRRLGEPEVPKDGEKAGDIVATQFNSFCKLVVNEQRKMHLPDAVHGFLGLCQSASFVARGRHA